MHQVQSQPLQLVMIFLHHVLLLAVGSEDYETTLL